MKSILLVTLVSGLSLGGLRAVQAQHYQGDDGTAEGAVAYSDNAMVTDYGSIYLREFTLDPAYNQITSISVDWGDPYDANVEDVNGLPMEALLYSAPNSDPALATPILLSSVAGTIQSVGMDTFVTYMLPAPVTVSTADFFVGYYVPGFQNPNGLQYYAGFDTSTSGAASFVFAKSDYSEPSYTDLSQDDASGSNVDVGIPGDYTIRANAVPEPGATLWLLAAGGLAAAGGRWRRTQRRFEETAFA